MGLLALSICAYLAAVYLTLETEQTERAKQTKSTGQTEGALHEVFRRKALMAGTAVVALSAVTLPLLRADAPHLFHGLFSLRGAPALAAGAAAALVSGAALLRRKFRLARIAATAQVAFLLGGWGIAQYPYMIYPSLTLHAAAAPQATLNFLLWTLVPGLGIVVPSLIWLYRLFSASRSP